MTEPSLAPREDPPANELKSRGGPARLIHALRYSWQGLRLAFRHEAAFRQELAGASIAILLLFVLPLPALEKVLLLATVVLVLVVELLNSAIEAVVDRVSIERHPLAGRAKDLGSAAVFLSVLLAAIAWGWLAGPVLLRLLAH